MTIAEQLEKKGREEGKAEVALRLLTKNISIDIISETTGLSLKEIDRLRKNN